MAVPELALVRFLVLDDDFINDDFIGQLTVPVSCLTTGFKHVRLLNLHGEEFFGGGSGQGSGGNVGGGGGGSQANLFVKISITKR